MTAAKHVPIIRPPMTENYDLKPFRHRRRPEQAANCQFGRHFHGMRFAFITLFLERAASNNELACRTAMKRYRTKNVFRFVHVAMICIGFLASHLTAALHVGAAARKIGDGTAGGTSSVCSAGGNELPMAAIRPSTAVESAPLLNNTLPRDVALSGAVASCEALAGVFAAISVRNTNQDLPFRHSLVTRHVRLQI